MRIISSILTYLLFLTPIFLAATWSSWPALQATAAYLTTPDIKANAETWNDPTQVLNLRRTVQGHFRTYGIYLPIEDVVVADSFDEDSTLAKNDMQAACGEGKVFVWVPFRFRLPVVGERVWEWCWKPPVTTQS